MLGELKKFNVQKMLILENTEIDNHRSMRKDIHSSPKLIFNDSNIDKAKIRNSVRKYWIVKRILNMVLRCLSVSVGRNNSIEKWK